MSIDNILKIVELRERYRGLKANCTNWIDFNSKYRVICYEMKQFKIKEHEVLLDDEVFNLILETKPEIKVIYDDCYHAVESHLISQSNK
jgi:hypothetical protein